MKAAGCCSKRPCSFKWRQMRRRRIEDDATAGRPRRGGGAHRFDQLAEIGGLAAPGDGRRRVGSRWEANLTIASTGFPRQIHPHRRRAGRASRRPAGAMHADRRSPAAPSCVRPYSRPALCRPGARRPPGGSFVHSIEAGGDAGHRHGEAPASKRRSTRAVKSPSTEPPK